MTAYRRRYRGVEAMRVGALDYLLKPLRSLAELDLGKRSPSARLREVKAAAARDSPQARRGRAPRPLASGAAMQPVDRSPARPHPVLILGESGTGKELVARAIHDAEPAARRALRGGQLRRARPRRCSRASSSATKRAPSPAPRATRAGLSSWPTAARSSSTRSASCRSTLQAKLLRVLEDRESGASATRARAASTCASSPPPTATWNSRARRAFREDLFYRLNVVTLELPPLRERREDVRRWPRFLTFFGRQYHRPGLGPSAEALRLLLDYAWPGNVRELRNAVERAIMLAEGRRGRPGAAAPEGGHPGYRAAGLDGLVRRPRGLPDPQRPSCLAPTTPAPPPSCI